MIWFSEDVVEPSMVYRHYLDTLSNAPLDADEDESFDLSAARRADIIASDTIPPSLLVQKEIVTAPVK